MIFLSQTEDFYKVIEALKELKAPTEYVADRTIIYGYRIADGSVDNRLYTLSHCLFYEDNQEIHMFETKLSDILSFHIADVDTFIDSISVGHLRMVTCFYRKRSANVVR